ncbi:MAG: hypothetical protein A3J74_01430 [Elusimicrobia bacterium RIFCSPHIGHO2_02_FULL_57_9]|nr:MAG: hypothetical protein A3J74_01430 [Elusimicrobia bacterium RIFCSPHIGHO2_02_FULL_57_9]
MKLLEVAGKSMSPLLKPGDRIQVRRVKPAQIRWGDIIVYSRRAPGGNQLKVHRVLFRQETLRGPVFWTKGDWDRRLDGPVPSFSVIGIVTARERNGDLKLLHTPLGKAQTLAMAGIGTATAVLWRLVIASSH